MIQDSRICFKAIRCILALLLALQAVQARPNVNTTTERLDGKLNVHVIALLAPSDAQASTHTITSSEEDEASSTIRKFDAEYMFETVLTSLLDSTDRTIACSDVASFVRWWQRLHPETQAVVRELVQSGRWEFVNGGLVENDEAASYYAEMLDQMTLGMRFLRNELGATPKIAWASRGSGHSAAEASLKAMGGFQGMFQDMSSDKQALQKLQARKAAEFIWRSSQALGPASNIFIAQYDTSWWCLNKTDTSSTTAADCMADIYQQFQVPNAPMPGTKQRPNLQQLVDHFVARAELLSSYTPGSDVPFVVQHNFSMASGAAWFAALDTLMHSVNADGRVNVLYSTPSLYVHAKKSNSSVTFAVRDDDSMPYPTKAAGQWGGLYSSTAIMQGFVRTVSGLLHASQQLEVLTEQLPSSQQLVTERQLIPAAQLGLTTLARSVVMEENFAALPRGPDNAQLEFALALAHAHSGISGMKEQMQQSDYAARMEQGVQKAAAKFLMGLHQLVFGPAAAGGTWNHVLQLPHLLLPGSSSSSSSSGTGRDEEDDKSNSQGLFSSIKQFFFGSAAAGPPEEEGPPQLHLCLLLNESICTAAVKHSNPVQMKLKYPNYRGPVGFLMVAYNPLPWTYTWGVRVPVGDFSGRWLVHGPQGYVVPSQRLSLVQQGSSDFWDASPHSDLRDNTKAELALQVQVPPLGHAVFSVKSVGKDSRRSALGGSAASEEFTLKYNDKPYRLSNGHLEVVVSPAQHGISFAVLNGVQFRYSAAFMHHAASNAGAGAVSKAMELKQDTPRRAHVTIVKGPLVQEVREVYNDIGAVVTRLWKGANSLEVEWFVKSSPAMAEEHGDLVLRYETSVSSSGVFYTDANGREWQQRRLNYRPSYKYDVEDPSAPPDVEDNVYPAAAGFGIRDSKKSFFVATDRAHAVMSLHPGQLDVVIARAVSEQPSGADSAKDDATIASGRHVVSFGLASDAAAQLAAREDPGSSRSSSRSSGSSSSKKSVSQQLTTRHLQHILHSPLVLAFSRLPDIPFRNSSSSLAVSPSLSSNPLSKVAITSMKWLACSTVLLRLSHIFQPGEHPSLASPASVQLDHLLKLKIAAVQETTLFGDKTLSEARLEARGAAASGLTWHTQGSLTEWQPKDRWPQGPSGRVTIAGALDSSSSLSLSLSSFSITLQPMQIRTFLVTVQRQHSECVSKDGDETFAAPGQDEAAKAASLEVISAAAGVSNSGQCIDEKPADAYTVIHEGLKGAKTLQDKDDADDNEERDGDGEENEDESKSVMGVIVEAVQSVFDAASSVIESLSMQFLLLEAFWGLSWLEVGWLLLSGLALAVLAAQRRGIVLQALLKRLVVKKDPVLSK